MTLTDHPDGALISPRGGTNATVHLGQGCLVNTTGRGKSVMRKRITFAAVAALFLSPILAGCASLPEPTHPQDAFMARLGGLFDRLVEFQNVVRIRRTGFERNDALGSVDVGQTAERQTSCGSSTTAHDESDVMDSCRAAPSATTRTASAGTPASV